MPVSGLKNTQTLPILTILSVHNKVNIEIIVPHYPNDSEIHGRKYTTIHDRENMFISFLVGLQLQEPWVFPSNFKFHNKK